MQSAGKRKKRQRFVWSVVCSQRATAANVQTFNPQVASFPTQMRRLNSPPPPLWTRFAIVLLCSAPVRQKATENTTQASSFFLFRHVRVHITLPCTSKLGRRERRDMKCYSPIVCPSLCPAHHCARDRSGKSMITPPWPFLHYFSPPNTPPCSLSFLPFTPFSCSFFLPNDSSLSISSFTIFTHDLINRGQNSVIAILIPPCLPSFTLILPKDTATVCSTSGPISAVMTSSSLILYQNLLPTELWRLVLQDLSTLDLFSLYNTSHRMRHLSAPFLVQAMATKSLRLFFYQEYVRRVGIRFVFDSFDLARDRVIFRPQILQNQYRFRSGLTLQNPQLEEVAIKSSGVGIELTKQRVHCRESRYFTVRDAPLSCSSSSTLPSKKPSSRTLERDGFVPNRRTADEKGYQGNKNFLDKSCPVHIRRHGIRKVDGSRYSFMQDYPWSLHYQVESEPLDSTTSCSSGGGGGGGGHGEGEERRDSGESGNISSGTDDAHFALPSSLTLVSDSPPELLKPASRTQTSPITGSTMWTARRKVNKEGEKSNIDNNNSIGGSGPRYFRALRFECSMNFLDPRRATRNIIGRWLEGKMQHWKRVLGGRRYGILPPPPGSGKASAPLSGSSSSPMGHQEEPDTGLIESLNRTGSGGRSETIPEAEALEAEAAPASASSSSSSTTAMVQLRMAVHAF